MVAIYAAGMVAAVRLLERFTIGWWMAVISVVLAAGLLVLAGCGGGDCGSGLCRQVNAAAKPLGHQQPRVGSADLPPPPPPDAGSRGSKIRPL